MVPCYPDKTNTILHNAECLAIGKSFAHRNVLKIDLWALAINYCNCVYKCKKRDKLLHENRSDCQTPLTDRLLMNNNEKLLFLQLQPYFNSGRYLVSALHVNWFS